MFMSISPEAKTLKKKVFRNPCEYDIRASLVVTGSEWRQSHVLTTRPVRSGEDPGLQASFQTLQETHSGRR